MYADLGSIYEATAAGAGGTVTARSAPYRGPVVPVPSGLQNRVDGAVGARPHVGSVVEPGRTRWFPGGIGQLGEGLQLQSCSDAAANDCRVLRQWGGPLTTAIPEPIAIGPAEEGRWLRTVDRIFGAPDPRLGRLAGEPMDEPSAWRRSDGLTTWITELSGPVAPAPVGARPIGSAPPRRAATPARVTIARRLAASRPLRVATVRCGGGCSVRVALSAGRRRVVLRQAARRAATLQIVVGRAALRRLADGRGRLTVRAVVRVDGRVAGRGLLAVAPRLLRR
jgi:hypothetical protein